MIKNRATNVRKFPFFELIKESSKIPPEEIPEDDPSKPIHLQKSNISVCNITPSGARQMHAIDGLVFLNGKAIHKKDGKMIRESLIMKILDNEVIDEYRIFNGVYYDFSLHIFEEKPYFVVVGGNFNEYMIDGHLELFMATAIKIYDATNFIKKKNERYPVPPNLNPTDEPYPKLLIKKIKLLKKLSDEKLVCDTEGDKMEGYESFQNINAFSINDSFTHAAISLDKGGILLIYAFPNLLECSTKRMKMIYLPKILVKDREPHITNLDFAEIIVKNELKRILYATTANSVYYYEWKLDNDKHSNAENKIKLVELNQDGKGAYSGCVAVKNKSLLMGSSYDDFIAEFDNLEFGKTWFFDGKKTIVKYYKDYILFVIFGETESSLQIYDRKNQFFAFFEVGSRKVTGVCSDDNFLYALYEETANKKYIVKMKEIENEEKFKIFFNKKLFDTACTYAESLGFDKSKIAEISRKHAEYEYSKGDFNKSIEEYIKTINYYEPSLVVQKFLEKSKLDYLIKYLEAIVYSVEFKVKDGEEHKNYTTLLLNCYVMQEKIPKLKEFIDKKGQYFSQDLIRTVIDVCLETQNVEIALAIAKQNLMNEEYLKILITKMNKLDEAINFIENPENYGMQLNNDDKIQLFCKFGEYFLKNEENEKDYSDAFFETVTKFIENNINIIDKKDIVKLIQIFVVSDKFFKILFEKMNSFHLDYNKEMLHRRIEIYLEEGESNKNENYKTQIINIIKDERYIGKYDSSYLMLLFKYRNFIEGIEVLSELLKLHQELLNIYINKHEYKKIIDLCCSYGDTEQSFWGTALNFFIDKNIKENLPKEELLEFNKYFEEFLNKLLNSGAMLPVSVLDIINEQNNDISLNLLNNFMTNAINKEIKSIENTKKTYEEYSKNLDNTVNEITELKTKAFTFNVSKCDECRMPINVPFTVFECGHCFHSLLCLNASNDKKEKISCPKCKDKKNKVYQEINSCRSYYESVNNVDKLESELAKSKDKIDFIHKLYGKGLFYLGPVRDQIEKKE